MSIKMVKMVVSKKKKYTIKFSENVLRSLYNLCGYHSPNDMKIHGMDDDDNKNIDEFYDYLSNELDW